jgi:hypothetical protein
MTMVRRAVLSFLAVSCLLSFPSINASAEAATLTLINRSSNTLFLLYASPAYSDEWGYDLLSRGGLPPGYRQTFYLGNACLYDFKVVARSGAEIRRWDQSACPSFEWTLYD